MEINSPANIKCQRFGAATCFLIFFYFGFILCSVLQPSKQKYYCILECKVSLTDTSSPSCLNRWSRKMVGVINTRKSKRHTKKLEWRSSASIKQQHALPMTLSMRYRVQDFLSLLSFSFLLSLPSLSVPCPVCLVFDFLCFMQKPPCPEGIDLQDCFDPVVMILLFASATSFFLLQSPHKML